MKKYWILAIIAYMLTACQESLEDRCARESKEYTKKNCPVKIDNNTTLDSLTFERETHTLHYYYKLTGLLKNTTTLRVYKENKYRFAYTYRSEKDPSKIMLEVVFTDKDY